MACRQKKGIPSITLTISLVVILSAGLVNLDSVHAQSASTNISNNSLESGSPNMALSGENIYVAWQDFSPLNFEILFASSTDGGATFGQVVDVSNSEGASSQPRVAASGDIVYVVWQDTFPTNDIFIASSTDGGVTFSEPVNISNSGAASPPQISASGDSVYVAWQDSILGNSEIFVASSTDGGATFGQPVNVSNSTDGFSSGPQFALSQDGTIYLLWSDTFPANDIFIASSTDGGATFSEPVNISNSGAASLPQISLSEDSVYVAWQDDGTSEIFVASSTDGGATFGQPVNVSDNPGFSVAPVLASSETDPSSVFVAWVDISETGDIFDIFIASSTDGGSSFSDGINVSNTPGPSFTPQIATNGGNVYLSWSDNVPDTSNDEVLLASSVDGVTFGCPVNVSNNPTSSGLSQLAVSPGTGNLNILWTDPLQEGNFEVLLQSNFDPAAPYIIIDSVTSNSPKWDLDSVQVSGTVGNADANADTVTVDWGDGTRKTKDIPLSGCSWGPVSHTYSSSAIAGNPNQLSAKLIADDGKEKTTTLPTEINVQKHSTILSLDPISSVKQNSTTTVAGLLTDADTMEGIGGQTISFDGTGAAGILEPAITADTGGGHIGEFSSSGPAPITPLDKLVVQAHFAGDDNYEPSDSGIRTYDTADESAVQFNVPAGANSFVDLSGFFTFNASIEFEEVVADGVVFVSQCDSPESGRYSDLDLCLRISSGVQMLDGTAARVKMSFAGIDLPVGTDPEEIDVFHEELTMEGSTGIVDITESRDLSQETVTGRTTSFSKFIAGVALYDPEPAGAYREQIFVQDGNTVSLRDIANRQNSSAAATASFDKSTYKMSDSPVLTIVDANGNVDPDRAEITYAAVKSETSNPFSIQILLTENAVNSGVFEGSFSFTSEQSSTQNNILQATVGDELSVHYLSGARAQAVIDGVVESGLAQFSDFIVPEGLCLKPIGGAVNLELVDAKLGPEGKITFTLSYRNANLRGFDPSSFRMVHEQDQTWVDITLPDPEGRDLDAMTVTGETSTPGPFSLAVDLDDCSGGAGGGLGRPGAGIVVDFVASIVKSQPTGGGGGGGGGTASDPTPSSSPSATSQVPAGGDIESEIDLSGTSGDVLEVRFENVVSNGSINVIEQKPYDLPAGTFTSVGLTKGTLSVDGSESETVGTIFDISTSSGLTYNGTVDITIPYDPDLISNQPNDSNGGDTGPALVNESDVRFLFYNGNAWEDATIYVNTTDHTVTGRLSALSPVVAGIVPDGTFGPMYFEENPLTKAGVSELALRDSEGRDATQVVKGQTVVIGTSIKNVQRVEQSYSYIVQVFDQNGVTVSLKSTPGSLAKAEIVKAEQSWTSAEIDGPGGYTVKVYVWSQLGGSGIPIPLSEVMTTTIRVLDV